MSSTCNMTGPFTPMTGSAFCGCTGDSVCWPCIWSIEIQCFLARLERGNSTIVVAGSSPVGECATRLTACIHKARRGLESMTIRLVLCTWNGASGVGRNTLFYCEIRKRNAVWNFGVLSWAIRNCRWCPSALIWQVQATTSILTQKWDDNSSKPIVSGLPLELLSAPRGPGGQIVKPRFRGFRGMLASYWRSAHRSSAIIGRLIVTFNADLLAKQRFEHLSCLVLDIANCLMPILQEVFA